MSEQPYFDRLNGRCPKPCGHMHPNGMGVGMCGRACCSTLWFEEPELMAPAYQAKRAQLVFASRAEAAS